jgi:hypothetical protein
MSDLVAARVRLSSPDRRHALEFLPLQSWSWADDPMMVQAIRQAQAVGQGCPAAPPMPAAEAVRQLYLPRFRPGARVIGVQPDAAAAQALRDQLAPTTALARGPQAVLRTDAARLRLAAEGGSEEWLAVAVSTVSYPMLVPSMAAQGNLAPTMLHDSVVHTAYAFRAPQGGGGLEAAEPLLGTMLASIRLNPAWQAALEQLILSIGRTRIAGAVERARIWRDAMNQIGEMRMRSWQQSQESRDRIAHAFSQAIRGVETMTDPRHGTRIEVPSGYNAAWVNNYGEVLLSNEPNFDPNRSERGGSTWTPLQRP